jgi:nucleotide-binding universal stress UspA family protein
MSDFLKKILWPTDFSDEAQEALTQAEHLAKTFGAELVALHVVPEYPVSLYNSVISVKGELIRRIDVIKNDAMDRLLQLEEGREVSFRPLIREGNAAKEIIAAAEEEGVDLIVMGKKGLSALEKIFIGSVANQVLRHSKVPLFLTKQKSGPLQFDKILVPTDFSEHEEVERDYAWKLAKVFDAELVFLHVLELHDHEFPPRMLDEMMDTVTKKLAARKKSEKEDVKITEDVTRALHAALGIVDYAETHKCDMIVISTCGPGAIERFFLGSTTEKVISNSSVPVFALPSHYCKV